MNNDDETNRTLRDAYIERQRVRHDFLHRAFDELLACFIGDSRPGETVLQRPIEDLLHWSHAQTKEPTCDGWRRHADQPDPDEDEVVLRLQLLQMDLLRIVGDAAITLAFKSAPPQPSRVLSMRKLTPDAVLMRLMANVGDRCAQTIKECVHLHRERGGNGQA